MKCKDSAGWAFFFLLAIGLIFPLTPCCTSSSDDDDDASLVGDDDDNDDNDDDLNSDPINVQIGPDGGTAEGLNGVSLIIPAGALDEEVTIGVTINTTAIPDDSWDSVGEIYELSPDGLSFNEPVEITLPYDATLLPQSVEERDIVAFHSADGGANWVIEGGTVSNGELTAEIDHFSLIAPGTSTEAVNYVNLSIDLSGYSPPVIPCPLDCADAQNYIMSNFTCQAVCVANECGSEGMRYTDDPCSVEHLNCPDLQTLKYDCLSDCLSDFIDLNPNFMVCSMDFPDFDICGIDPVCSDLGLIDE